VNAIRDNAHLVAEEMVRASAFPKMPHVEVGAIGAGIPEMLAALAGNTLNMTVINPVGVPTEEVRPT
jgi:hypothetical protein